MTVIVFQEFVAGFPGQPGPSGPPGAAAGAGTFVN